MKPYTIQTPKWEVEMTASQFATLIGGEIADQHGMPRFVGPWSILVGYKAPAIKRHWNGRGSVTSITFYGERSLYKIEQEGYGAHGRVKVAGKEMKGYTSSILVSVDGKLVEVAVISLVG